MMMSNLFSIFDPTMGILSLSWGLLFLVLFFFPVGFWVSGNFYFLFIYFFSGVKTEVDFAVPFYFKGSYLFVTSIFLTIFLYNFLALFPYLFSFTSHLLVTLPLSFIFWVSIILFSCFNFFRHFLSHLIPLGTPLGLISFMVLVELLSNFIRPVALTFRLTANMMAGHLLMSLIGSGLLSFPLWGLLFGSLFQSLLVFMELGVSLIQAYVFCTLLVLYMSEGVSS